MLTQEELEYKQNHPVLAASATGIGKCIGFVRSNKTTIMVAAVGCALYAAVEAKHSNRHDGSLEDEN